jgi:hypothetical protein
MGLYLYIFAQEEFILLLGYTLNAIISIAVMLWLKHI